MSPHSQPLVSIVTPVYNGAEYLAECIESVQAQTYTTWDYTIVNNCSTDQSLQIAEAYAAKDRRIRVHNNETFARVIQNHNIALRQISPESKYCKMVFADDWLYPECLERMVALTEAHPTVGIVAAYGLRGTDVVWTGLPYPSTVVSGREVCRLRLLGGPYVFGTATAHMIRADLIRGRHAFYNESNLHADAETLFELLKTCDFGFVHQILSYTRIRDQSITSLSEELNTFIAANLYHLVTYGPCFLSQAELEYRMKALMREYYKSLAGGVLQRRGKQFWEYHKRKLNELGTELSRPRLVWAVCTRAMKKVIERSCGGLVKIA